MPSLNQIVKTISMYSFMLQNVIVNLMTRQKHPDRCDFCSIDIELGSNQYLLEIKLNDGTTSFNEQVRGQNRIDMCSACFIERLGKSGYEPNWIREVKNENYKAGSKKADEKYFIPKLQNTGISAQATI